MVAREVFVDTNVLVYATQAGRGGMSTVQHAAAEQALRRLQNSGTSLWLSPQILREYLSVVTRPQGSSPAVPVRDAVADVRRFVNLFTVVEDSSRVTDTLLGLVQQFPSGGRQIHDANIVAKMLSHGIKRLLTFNTADFQRFSSLIDIEPA
jgi:predicted nucleic acid-binding protein